MEIALFCDGRTTLKRPGKRLVVGQSLNLCHLSTATGDKLQPHWVEGIDEFHGARGGGGCTVGGNRFYMEGIVLGW